MSDVSQIFTNLQSRYQIGKVTEETIYYFSIGDAKYTLFARPDGCEVQEGKTVDNAHCVVKADPKLFSNMVLHGRKPGMLDITRGKIKFSDMALVMKLQELFGLNIA
jgi:putative sterol carrier protein